MATLQVLETAYSDVSRIKFSNISTADVAKLQTLASQVDAATLTLADARAEIGKMVLSTTSVANLSYAFFVGVTPKLGGLDFLISPTGVNATNLNSTYYAAFSAENRYINFSVALGKGGEGQARFAANYGALDLTAAATKAYAEIFGFAPAAGKIDAILNGQVPNGLGGTYTRAEYFASYGGDGLTGQGTKAAMVGWLLSEAAKADLGVYAKANDALLADITDDGQAKFNVDLLGVYGAQPTFATGATIAVTSSQSVAPDAASAALQSTGNNDTVTGTDSNASQSIATSGGHDTISFSGTVSGFVDGGDGNDTINIGVLSAKVEVLGGAPNGTVNGGAGNDVITIGRVVDGAIIDGGAGDDTAVIGIVSDLYSNTKITNVEHLVLSTVQIANGGIPTFDMTGLKDITTRASGAVILNNIADGVALKMEGAVGNLTANYHLDLIIVGHSSTTVGASAVHVYLSGVAATGGVAPNLTVSGDNGSLYLHVQSDSVLGTVHAQRDGGVGSSDHSPVVISGIGHLTAAFDGVSVDASAAAGVTITRVGGSNNTSAGTTVVLSGGNDQVAADLHTYGAQTYTLGAGSDTFSIYQAGGSISNFANVLVAAGQSPTFATITDFAKGVDHIELGPAIASVTLGLTAGASTTLDQALISVSGQIAANTTAVFEYNGDTYIYHQDATVAVNTGDGLIKLAGVTGLTVGTGATSVDIHYG